MELKQSDRDSLRTSQQKINPKVIFGGIVEHKTQDPRRYKEISREKQDTEQSCHDETNGHSEPHKKFQLNYKSKFFDSEPKKPDVIKKLCKINGDLPISPIDVKANSWLNMDRLEYDKLEWLSENYQKSNYDKDNYNSSTKFDKEGRVVLNIKSKEQPTSEINTDLNQEMENIDAAYDLNDLVNLLSSTYPRHTTYSLIVIRKIANLANCGFYDGSFDENILQILLKTCLLRVRSHMDSSDTTTCLNALKCLRSLLCNTELDEINLDRIHPVISDNIDTNIWLQSTESNKKEFTEEMKDQECIEIDPILGLIERTSLIQRILYLLNIKVPFDYYECIIDILIRLARHSRKVCSIINNGGVLNVVSELFLSSKITSETDHISGLSYKALKLVRIIAQATLESEAEEEKIKFDHLPKRLIEPIRTYFFIDCYNLPEANKKSLFMLHIESLRTIKVLSKMKDYSRAMLDLIALGQASLFDSARSIVNLASTGEIKSTISMEWQYAANVIDLIGHYKEGVGFINTFLLDYIKPTLLQWLNDIMKEKYIPHFDVSIAITTAFKHLNNYQNDVELDSLIVKNTAMGSNNEFFKLLIREASTKSCLPEFAKYSGNSRDPVMLRSYGTMNFNTTNEQKFEICPLLDKNSPYLLLNVIITKLHDAEVAYNLHFINDISFFRYIKSTTLYQNLETTYESHVRKSSIAQYEVKLIANLLLLVVRYYLEFTNEIFEPKDDQKTVEQLEEPEDFKLVREDCYSNIIHYTVGLIGLLNLQDSDGLKVRDKLLENILFNDKLQFRLTNESYKKRFIHKEPKKVWQVIEFKDFQAGTRQIFELSEKQYKILFPIYKIINQYNRYWIFEPILMYYLNQVCWDEKESKTKNEHWFRDNIDWKNYKELMSDYDDAKLINVILEFHFTILIYCPTYTLISVKSNVEDYLCLIGCLFLHDDIFLNEDLNSSIKYNIRMILNDCLNISDGKLETPFSDAKKKIGPLNNLPLGDFFARLIDQYESVSYGDSTFSNFLLLFIGTGCDLTFRKKLFQERIETCLSVLKITPEDLWSPRELFFTKKETDPEMKLLLRKSIPHIPKGSFLLDYVRFHI